MEGSDRTDTSTPPSLNGRVPGGQRQSVGTLETLFKKNLCCLSFFKTEARCVSAPLAPSFMPSPPASSCSPPPTQSFTPFFSSLTSLLSVLYWNKGANMVSFENLMTISSNSLQDYNLLNEKLSFFQDWTVRIKSGKLWMISNEGGNSKCLLNKKIYSDSNANTYMMM